MRRLRLFGGVGGIVVGKLLSWMGWIFEVGVLGGSLCLD